MLMANEKPRSLLERKIQETKDELRAKALKVAHEVAEDVQDFTKVKLTFDQFNLILEKIKGIATEGYISALMLLYYAGSEL